MMSNKWTFSLTSLITIIALAFVVSPALAGEFDVTLDESGDVSAADGLQLVHPGTSLTVTVKFGEIATIKGDDVFATTYDKNGKLVDIPDVTASPENTAAEKATLTIPVTTAVEKVSLKIKAGKVAPANPLSPNTGKKLEKDIFLIGGDAGAPTVYSMERVGLNFRQLKTPKINPTANPTVQVRITLSEMPKEFKTDHIDVAEGAATTVTALVPETGATLDTFLAGDNAPENPPRKRGVYDESIPTKTAADLTSGVTLTDVYDGSAPNQTLANPITANNYDTRTDQLKARKMYGGIHRAINEAKILTGTAYKYKSVAVLAVPTGVNDIPADLDPDATDVEFGIANAEYSLMTVKDATTVVIGQFGVQATPSKPDKTVPKPAVPAIKEYLSDALYARAVIAYVGEYNEYVPNANQWAQYNAYTAAVDAEEKKDDDARMEHYEDSIADGGTRASLATGANDMLYPYLVTITPTYANTKDVVVKVKAFEDTTKPVSQKYIPPINADDYQEGVDKLTIEVSAAKEEILDDGLEVAIPKDIRIPANGFTVFAKNIAGSGIQDNPENDKDEPKATKRTPAQLKYNLVALSNLPNLERFLSNGGTIALVAPAGVYISEIMWGSDASLDPNYNSQWIEIANSGSTSILTGDNTHKLVFYGINETVPSSGVADTVGTVGTGGFWSITGIGQNGRTGTGEKAADVVAVVPTQALKSMQRKMNADGTPADGTLQSSWVQSEAPAVNFAAAAVGIRIGSPGAAIDSAKYPTAPTPTTPTPKAAAAVAGDIVITEIMVDTGDGRLPQWIELTNVSGVEKNLAGWSIKIENSDADADAVGPLVEFNLTGTLGVGNGLNKGGTMGKTLLLVAWDGRHSSNLAGSKTAGRIVDVSSTVGEKGRYKLISDEEFKISLIPPLKTSLVKASDIAGNLGEAWEIEMDEGNGRSSLIRREELADGSKPMGTDANGWILAANTSLTAGPATWYGSDEDAGTPGSDSGGPLPVELSHFRPARDKQTGAVVITWATQSELNNAGFFIKRSNQKNGEFKVVNATMIAGAGTTSEKQFYTYTDTTAQPNVVYYYQIEDVSLDGNRQLLTRGTRLKGHIGAAGKATVTWGELKTSNE